ncbi:MAG: hypothetical protein O3B67_00085 [archaeon]|nr:hypothetical protein [archaeon]
MTPILLALLFLTSLLPVSTEAASVLDRNESLIGSTLTEIHGIHGSLFVVRNSTHVLLLDVANNHIIDAEPCSDFLRVNGNATIVMCGGGTFNVSQSGFHQRFGGPVNQLSNPETNYTVTVAGNNAYNDPSCLRGSGGQLTISNGSSTIKQISISSPTSSQYARSYLLGAVLHEDSNKVILIFTYRGVSSGGCEDDYARYLEFDFTTTSSITLGNLGTSLNLKKSILDVNHGAILLGGFGEYASLAIASGGVLPLPNSGSSIIGQYKSPRCSMSSTDSGAVGDYITIGNEDVPVSSAPSQLACTSESNGTFLTSQGWGTVWMDSDGDSVGDLSDAFPSEVSQWADIDGDGFGENPGGVTPDSCPSVWGTSFIDVYGCLDIDGDGVSNSGDSFPSDISQWNDTDADGFGDNISGFRGDACPSEFGLSSRNNTYGCPDADYDGWADIQDFMPNDASQWKDSDGDGYGNQLIGFQGDACPQDYGESWQDRFGCLDSDGDGWSDKNDAFPFESTQYSDRDLDGYGDNQSEGALLIDAFPGDTTQWDDMDGDGYGDNQNGNVPDRFPNDPTRWQDSDHDGVADEDDAFPDDATQDTDSDGDGYGDNINGNRGDVFPNDPNEWSDTDGDGVGNNGDAFPFNPSQTQDRDGDRYGDNPTGTGADAFFDDPTQWIDVDGDGYGDNIVGTNADKFPRDITQWYDRDGDGCGDNPTGNLPDAFPDDATQCEDGDGDGLGDRPDGNNPDPYPGDRDNDGYADIEDPFPDFASPGDMDNDGVLDAYDAFPGNYYESADNDGDGEGDNADIDDDNDGWNDADEIRAGTDPFHPLDYPVDTFEIVIPGTQVGLGAWDLIGMFGGIPLFIWIMFGFVTRNGRTVRFEEQLRASQSRDELEQVAMRWEYMLMLRMLGPHQGIRLERLRAELDDRFEAQGQHLAHLRAHEVDQTDLVIEQMHAENVKKSIPAIEQAVGSEPMEAAQSVQSVALSNMPTADIMAHRSDENEYEWFTADDGTNFYRLSGSGAEWIKFEN